MEKVNKLLNSTSQCKAHLTARTSFITPACSTLASSRQKFRSRLELKPKNKFLRNDETSYNSVSNSCLKVKQQPLRSTEEKYLRYTEFVDTNCHKHKTSKINYFQEGKIIHRNVDWIMYNIYNYMVSLWIKNQRNYQSLHKVFYPSSELQLHEVLDLKTQNKSDRIHLKSTTLQINKSHQKLNQISSAFQCKYDDVVNFKFSNIFEANPSPQQQQINQVIQLIFQGKSKNFQQNISTSPLLSLNKIRNKKKEAQSISPYKIRLEEKQNQILNRITSKNQQLFPILLDFSRKILRQKQIHLIQKLLKNEKVNDIYLDSLDFEEKVKVYEDILMKRMKEFKILRQNFFKINKSTKFQIEKEKNLITEFIEKRQSKKSSPRVAFLKNIRIDDLVSFLDVKTIEQNSKFANFSVMAHVIRKRNSKQKRQRNLQINIEKDYANSGQKKSGLKNLNIQFDPSIDKSQDSPIKNQQQIQKKSEKQEISSLQDFLQIEQLNEQSDLKPKNIIPKNLKPIINFHKIERNQSKNVQIRLSTKKERNQQKMDTNGKKNAKDIQIKQTLLLPSKSKELKQQDTYDILSQKFYQNNESQSGKHYERKHSKIFSKKRLDFNESPNRKYFLKNKRKGIKFNALTTKKFLKFLHEKNKAKLAEGEAQQRTDQYFDSQMKEKSKYLSADNSFIKSKYETVGSTQKFIKNASNFHAKKQPKQTERILRKKTDKRKTSKVKGNTEMVDSPELLEKQLKPMSKLKRLKFQVHKMMNLKMIEKILNEKSQIGKEKDTHAMRDRMVGYFHRLLQSGLFENEGLAQHKENVESLIRNYDQRRRNAQKKSGRQGQRSDKAQSQSDEFKINVKIRHDDPYIFERLIDIHSGLKKNQKQSVFRNLLIENEDLDGQLKEIKKNQEANKVNTNIEFDLDSTDFVPQLIDHGIDESSRRSSTDDEQEMIEFMKRLIKKSYLFLGQKAI